MKKCDDSKLAKLEDRWTNIVHMRTDRALRHEISRRCGGNPLTPFADPAQREQSSVIGEDLRSFYALVEEAGAKEVCDRFSPAEAGALISAGHAIELSRVDPARLVLAFQSHLQEHGALEYWGVEQLPILRKLASLSILAQHFLLWRLDEQARHSGHSPTRDTIELALEDIGLRSRSWGEGGWAGDVPRLYSASLVLPEHRGCKDVGVSLLRYARTRPVLPYRMLLGESYGKVADDMLPYLESAVDELFTKPEVQYVKRYVEEAYGFEVAVHERDLHSDIGTMGVTGLPTGGSRGMLLLGGLENPELPFPVAGCYDLHRHEPIGEADATEEDSAPEDSALEQED